jgi:hypothetical protein
MDRYLLQEWTTVQAFEPTILSVTQPSALWLDLGHARDVTFYSESVNNTNEALLRYETSPTRDAAQFREMASVSAAKFASPRVKTVQLYDNPAVPLARWVRWRLTRESGTGVWGATFRIVVYARR